MHEHQMVKIIGANGQISLGKEFAGKTVLIDQVSPGTWIIKSGEFIPDSEKWLYQKDNLAKLEKALEWTEKNKPIDNFDQLVKKIKK
ncbi:MAG: hypothetical protein EPO11_05655 [Gammaproteobacteria bacterium]|nr:MAG: hypothetical protein EPO11_05655 [Gammaproteobacteria bacterium]